MASIRVDPAHQHVNCMAVFLTVFMPRGYQFKQMSIPMPDCIPTDGPRPTLTFFF